ncbi:unnamed protein product [Allacma fusca]|uniref:DH domain-containing protein n=1 Tax=Allacma fusca TaxID=39272 RepID=A0A8J2J1A1_9HEXA|nr:unnamed protein product [Allacma fusca]
MKHRLKRNISKKSILTKSITQECLHKLVTFSKAPFHGIFKLDRSTFFGDNSKMDLLVEQLNSYGKNGIPKPNIITCDDDELKLSHCPEDDWQAILGESLTSEMSERTRQQQTAIWELVETEVVYLKTIKVITDLFLACLYNLQSANILNEIDRDQLFSNIPDICKANKTLWLDCILPMVQKARESKQPFQPQELRNGFLNFGSTCQPYTRYCLDQTKCQQYCREKYQENEHFKAYLAWCETRKECNRLRLMDILVRPMQRLTKYSLLLKAILRHTEDAEQRRCLEEMIGSVERFVRSVNGTLRSRQDAERLLAIAERIECYDVVETRDDELESIVKSHSKLDLFHPMPGCRLSKRWLLFEGDLKIKDSFTSKVSINVKFKIASLFFRNPAIESEFKYYK